jgi:cysteinyl-tRNA synthetase
MNLAYQRFSRHTGTAALADEASSLKTIPYFEEKFRAALEDDLNAPRALAVLHELVTYANGLLEKNRLSTKAARLVVRLMKKFDSVLGLQLNVQRHEKSLKAPEEVMKLLREREQARKEKNWAEADRLRDEVKKLGFIIEDGPQGPSVLRASF